MPPEGYERLLLGHAVAVARSDVAAPVRQALVAADGSRTTLYEYAASQPNAGRLRGRGTAYAIPLGHRGDRVVVRRNRHGGLFARFTGERFLSPTRAPHELDASIALAAAGVPTPEILAYVLYPPGGLLQRADVASREIANSTDLADVLMGDDVRTRGAALSATAALVASLSRSGALHEDLNAKNVLLAPDRAYVLDLDRVRRDVERGKALDANLARLSRSLRKWRDRFGARISEEEIVSLERSARAQ
jgi:tRNA A-37 threonylcarbamoyl transferase component Bud32